VSEQAMTKAEVLDAVAREYARLLAAVDALGAGASSVPVTTEGWTAKDVLAHAIHWAGQLAIGLGAPIHPPAYLDGASGRSSDDEWNALAVAHYRDLSLEQVKGELDFIVRSLVTQIQKRDDAAMLATDAIPWGGDRPLWRRIGAETFAHWPEHAEDIARAAALGVT
jgi:hypothetical protein